jgi:hypothetical protein
MLLVAEVMSQLAVEGALDQGFGELLQQAILTEQVIGVAVVLQKFIEPFRCNWHNLFFLSRLNG